MYVILLILMIFLVPILLTKKFDKVKEVVANEEKQEEAEYVYKSYGTIKLLHAATGQIEELPMDEYLLGVVSAEMPASYEQEALKAQAVVARTYTVYKIKIMQSMMVLIYVMILNAAKHGFLKMIG